MTETNQAPNMQWVNDVNETLDYLQDDVKALVENKRTTRIAILAIGAGLAVEGFVMIQTMKAVRQISGALATMLQPSPMPPEEEQRARRLLNQEVPGEVRVHDIVDNTEVKAQAGSPVEVGSPDVDDEVRRILAQEDASALVEDASPLFDKGDAAGNV